jgi:hypothetical protein
LLCAAGDYCNLGSGVCCTDEFDCKSNKCVKKGPPPCASFAGIGEYCDLNAGKCCGGNRVRRRAGGWPAVAMQHFGPKKPAGSYRLIVTV